MRKGLNRAKFSAGDKLLFILQEIFVEILHAQVYVTWKHKDVAFNSSTMREHSEGNKESPNIIAPLSKGK